MNYNKIEKALSVRKLDLVLNLKHRFSSDPNRTPYLMYTFYSKERREIKIGHTKYLESLINSLLKSGYLLVEKRFGCKNEERLIKETLWELGLNPKNDQGRS